MLALSIIAIGFGIILSSILLYPFFETGFNTIANEYPNSKVYMLSLITNNSGISSVEIVGMDLTTENMIIVSIPKELEINGQSISSIYGEGGIKKMANAIEKASGLNLTDYLISTKSALDKYRNGFNYSTIGDLFNNIKKQTKLDDPISIFYDFKNFANNFKSNITLTKFIRILRFIETKPFISTISYPSIYINGITITNTTELKNFSMEMENCTPFHNPFSIKPVIINCANESSDIFYQTTWNKWSKNGYNFSVIPDEYYNYAGQNVVISISEATWKLSAIKTALEQIYPKLKFKFINDKSPDYLKLYYSVDNWAAGQRYYTLGNYDFVILLGNKS